MPRKLPPLDFNHLYRRYLTGESLTVIAESTGVNRTTISRHFKRRGFALRTPSEAKTLDMARLSDAERKRITAAANIARRGNTDPLERKIQRAATVERRQLHISPLDRRMLKLLGGGTLQKAIGPYNCDVSFEPIAVEIFGGSWHASGRHARRHRERTRHILDAGWHMVIVWVEEGRHPLRVAAANYVISLAEGLRSNPTPITQYRVIRGTGQEIVIGCAKDDEFPVKPPRERRVQIRCEHHR